MGLWREWLGRSGVPGPLDRLLAARRVDRATHAAVTAAARWAPLVLEAVTGRAGPAGGVPLLDALRAANPAELVACAALREGRPGPDALGRKLERAIHALDGPGGRAVRHGVPRGFADALAAREGRSGPLDPWLEAQGAPAPLWVAPVDDAVAGELRAEGYRVQVVGSALAVTGPRGITTSAAYRAGRIEVQDLASQRCGAAAAPSPGQRVWDVCAGRGGKTVQLARALRGRGVVWATDVDPKKLDQLRLRVKRAGVADVVRIGAWDGERPPAFGPEARRGFDVVLVDAPCSSTGTWRRNPDAKLRVDPTSLAAHAPLQRKLLELGRAAVRPGGRLVYATCSFAPVEDEEVAETFPSPATMTLHGPPALDADTLFVATWGG